MSASWSDERKSTAAKMWAEGRSVTEIAKQMGGLTRNAVIGQMHRMGLSNRPSTVTRFAPGGKPKVEPGVGGVPSTPRKITAAVEKEAPPPRKPAPPRVAEPRDPDAPQALTVVKIAPRPKPDLVLVPVGKPVALLDLAPACCKFAIGADPGRGNMDRQLFCAEPTGDVLEPYCPGHTKRAYTRAPTAAEKKAAQAYAAQYAERERAAVKQAVRR